MVAVSKGAIAASHHLATEAGAEALRAGGNAIDAALAAAATLCVIYPHNVALGGDLVALVRSPDGKVHYLNATGTAAQAETLEGLRARHGSALPLRHVDTITLPGGLRGWQALHDLGAALPWSAHFKHAIAYARDGVPVSSSLANHLADQRADLDVDPGMRAIFYGTGEPLAEGERLVQPALATTLETLSVEGADAFYTGALAERWIEGLGRLGSRLSLQDAEAYRVEWAEPLMREFRGYRVFVSPPNTQGFTLLRALQAVTEGDLCDPLGADAGALAEAFRVSNALRDTLLADPRWNGMTGDELLAHSGDLGDLTGAAEARPTGDTAGISAVSADGWAVSFINSVYHAFGTAILEPETGIVFQNRGTAFSLDADSPNAFAPGKRPRHTLMPLLVLQGDETAWVLATMGGQAQPQIHAHLLLRVLGGATPEEATSAPRWVVERQDPAEPHASVLVEDGVPDAAVASLERAGMRVRRTAFPSERLGHSNLIAHRDGIFTAASDPRSNGSAEVIA